jgi:hypothetical protein
MSIPLRCIRTNEYGRDRSHSEVVWSFRRKNLASSPFNSILDPRNKTDRYSHEENYVWTTTPYYSGTLHKLYGRCAILSVKFRSDSYYLLFPRINVVASTVPPINKYKIEICLRSRWRNRCADEIIVVCASEVAQLGVLRSTHSSKTKTGK